jgi:hypothetical protein
LFRRNRQATWTFQKLALSIGATINYAVTFFLTPTIHVSQALGRNILKLMKPEVSSTTEKITRDCRKLHEQELRNLYPSQIIKAIKSKKSRWTKHVTGIVCEQMHSQLADLRFSRRRGPRCRSIRFLTVLLRQFNSEDYKMHTFPSLCCLRVKIYKLFD